MTRPRNARCPENVLGWIAWYADDALSARQRGAVEAHAAECADCRAELEIISGAPFEIDHDLPDPDRLFREITARIDAVVEEEEGEEEGGDEGSSVIPIVRGDHSRHTDAELERLERFILDDSFDGLLDGSSDHTDVPGLHAPVEGPRILRTAWMAAAALALLFVGGLGGALFTSFGPGFETASGRIDAGPEGVYHAATVEAEPALAPDAGPALDVVFRDGATAHEISEALRSVGVSIVAGPSSLGVYRLRVQGEGARRPTAADAAAVAERLKTR
ncbi:MAG TPA: zf-HC2 domain-containing protein, partial [Deltaproteobacteria bacterium]|nr:zf-HC2 domain-containing protein [Deltaproteobacteria bacterium]